MSFYNSFVAFLATAVLTGTHVLFGTLGGIMNEKVGNTNLGIEGMMLMGASTAFLTALKTGSPVLSILVGGLAGLLGALLYAIVTVTLRGNQVVTGLALTIFGTGVSSLIGPSIAGKYPNAVKKALGRRAIPLLSKIPVLGRVLFDQSPFVLISLVCAVVLYIFYKHTRVGLNTRMVGEKPAAADASGINVTKYKYLNILCGGFLCGVGGAFFSVAYAGSWQNELTAGAGWIAVALVIFAVWNPLRAILGAYMFGIITGFGLKLQRGIKLFGHKFVVSSQLIGMLPYIITVVVLIIIIKNKKRENQPPAALGNAYFREER